MQHPGYRQKAKVAQIPPPPLFINVGFTSSQWLIIKHKVGMASERDGLVLTNVERHKLAEQIAKVFVKKRLHERHVISHTGAVAIDGITIKDTYDDVGQTLD